MTSSFRTMILFIVILLAQTMSACAPQTPESPSVPSVRVTIPFTEVRQLRSIATGRDYDIYIRLPDEYAQGIGKKYPVLYVLDGQWDFKLLDSIQGGLLYDNFVPEMIIVGHTPVTARITQPCEPWTIHRSMIHLS